uniref:NADH dehydrogenase subunit 5 n=1 Tax=Palisada intermedia TaxID=397057 RepID=UPI00286A0D03|nr:NADH dehydrogenase subunit 5 [Palisada intermedia]WMC20761.1 NADH dehydrogenase subunit 5 [Palisada intermedia]
MYLLVILLPFFNSIITGFGGRWLGFYGSSIISCLNLTITFLLAIIINFEICFNNYSVFLQLFSWVESSNLLINFNLLFDSLTAIMLVVVSLISLLVHIYSIDYMKSDPHFPRFLSFLSIFTFFMLILVTSGNFLQLFLGWEGVGLASYLLINFWFTRLSANKASLKALIVNRIGDLGVLMSILIILLLFGGTLDFSIIFNIVPLFSNYFFFYLNLHSITVIGFFLVIGAVGKSAQLGLHTWLPDAMEGPTPVSALIHAATMVTAGVFLLIRFSPLIEFSTNTLNFMITVGSITALFAAFTGTFQNDIKKVIAYSTCSQLGYMVFCCGVSCYNISLFHLFNHAFFKALLFLSAGSVIHAINDEQDMRKMGSLISFLPVTYSAVLIGSLALTGFPFLTGFYSKDLILENVNLLRNNNLNCYFGTLSCYFGTLSACFTSFYSFRLLYLTFINNLNLSRKITHKIKEPSSFILIPLFVLIFASVFLGFLFKEFFVGLGTDTWNFSLFIFPSNLYLIESEFLDFKLKWLPFFFTVFGFLSSTFINFFTSKIFINFSFFNNLFFLINKKWFIDFIYNKLIVYPLLNFGYFISFKNLDRGFIELIGPVGVSSFMLRLAHIFSFVQTGKLTHYIFFITFFLFFYFSIFLFFISLKSFLLIDLLLMFFILIFYLI